jgi:hypothetical protein
METGYTSWPFLVSDLEISVRTGNALKEAGIETLEQLLALTRAEVLRLRGAGVKAWKEVEWWQKWLRNDEGRVDTNEGAAVRAARELNKLVAASLDLRVEVVSGQVQIVKVLT